MTLAPASPWHSPSTDPNDETFGDIVEPVELADAGAYDAVLVGEPFDAAVIGRRGAADGPAAIRESLAGVKTHQFETGSLSGVGDLGDVTVPEEMIDSGDVVAIQETVSEMADAVHAVETLPVFLGGDNSLTYANVRPLLSRGRVGVINFDAHLDCREVHDSPTSGTPYRQLLSAGLDTYVCLGARHFETSTAYADYVEQTGGTIVTAGAVGRNVEGAISQVMDALSDVELVYLSVDCDVLDMAYAPGVSAPTPGGLTTRELYRLLRKFAADDRLAGIELVECAPPLDAGEKTVAAATRAIAHALSGALSERHSPTVDSVGSQSLGVDSVDSNSPDVDSVDGGER